MLKALEDTRRNVKEDSANVDFREYMYFIY